ncbi:MAG: hypothetical protein ACON4V_07390 [Parvibaculales bacterium]
MDDHHEFNENSQEKASRLVLLVLAVIFTFALGMILTSRAQAEDYENWPQQSRAERLGTFTYVYGSAGFVSHSGTEEGERAYRTQTGGSADAPIYANAQEDGDDMVVAGGFGVRFPSDWNFEFGLAVLNGAYDQQGTSGTNPKPDQPVFEMSVLKGFKLGGPPLLRYTARVGFASIDDPHTDDGAFFGIGVAHEPFRVELRQYDFGVFDSQVLQVSYIYDF